MGSLVAFRFFQKSSGVLFQLDPFLFFLYILGNFQEFLESTQLMILSWMRSISYMTTLWR
jgi:hypothetical protein